MKGRVDRCNSRNAMNKRELKIRVGSWQGEILVCRYKWTASGPLSGNGPVWTEFKDLVTSLVVFTYEALLILSCFHLIYSSLFFIFSIPTGFLPGNFCSALTGNTHHRRWRAPKSVDSPKWMLQIRTAQYTLRTSCVHDRRVRRHSYGCKQLEVCFFFTHTSQMQHFTADGLLWVL